MSSLASALQEWRDEPLETLSAHQAGDAIIELLKVKAQVDAEVARRVAHFDTNRSYEVYGSLSTAAWLRGWTRISAGKAAAITTTARRLRHLPATEAAWQAGDISFDHAKLIADAARGLDPAEFTNVETPLLDAATQVDPQSFSRLVRRWRGMVDDAALRADEDAAFDARRLHWSATFGGRWIGDAQAAPADGAVINTALQLQMNADHPKGDPRTPAQRRLDALVAICRHFLDTAAAPAPPAQHPHITITVPLQRIECGTGAPAELDGIGPISDATLAELACDAIRTVAVIDPHGHTMWVSDDEGTIPPRIAKLVRARDPNCGFPACHNRTRHLHHVHGRGGPSTIDQIIGLCHGHHTFGHREHVTYTRQPDGRWAARWPDDTPIRPPP